jgi:hypothetical protein
MKHERLVKNIIIALVFAGVFWFGIRPLFSGDTFKSYMQNLTSRKYEFGENEYAVIVIGSEPEGIAAAVASARTGLKTLLVTEDPDTGSYIKAAMISQMRPNEGFIKGKRVYLNKGIYEEIFGKLSVGFTPENYMATVDRIINEKNLKIIFNCSLTNVDIEGNRVRGITILLDGEEMHFTAGVYIDATQIGTMLELCGVPYKKGSEDINMPDLYMPVEFNFMITGVKQEDLTKIQKTSDYQQEFRLLLTLYERVNRRTKLESPTFINQSGEDYIITGLKQWGVDVSDPADVQKAYDDAMDEALMLTAYMKTALVPFADCTFKQAPKKLYIPEFRHYEGRYTLTVSDIMNNRNFKDKIALASAPVDAGKFVDQGFDYTIINPNVYSIPLGSIIPVNLDNVLMPGSKASFRSLAATSAGTIPTSITMGESAGLTAAYCFLAGKTPADLLTATDAELKTYASYLKRGGIYLVDFSEVMTDPSTKKPLKDSWAYGYIEELAEYGLVAGGSGNNFRLDNECSNEVFSVLLKNAIVKINPDKYTLKIDAALEAFETGDPLTGESACAMMLEARGLAYEKGKAFETAKSMNLIPGAVSDKLAKQEAVTMDVVYCLTIETAHSLK